MTTAKDRNTVTVLMGTALALSEMAGVPEYGKKIVAPGGSAGPRGFPRARSEAAARRASRKATKAKLKQQRHTRRKRK